jgi:hypothetical protein
MRLLLISLVGMGVPMPVRIVEKFGFKAQYINTSIALALGCTNGFKPRECIAVEFACRAPRFAGISRHLVQTQCLDIRCLSEHSEACVIVCFNTATMCPFLEAYVLELLCACGAEIKHEAVECRRVGKDKLVAVQNVSTFLVDLFACSKERRGKFDWFWELRAVGVVQMIAIAAHLGHLICGYTFYSAAPVFESSNEVDARRICEGIGVDDVSDFWGQLYEWEDLALWQLLWCDGFAFLSGVRSDRLTSRVRRTFAGTLLKSDSVSEMSNSSM